MNLNLATSNIGDAISEGLNLKVEDVFYEYGFQISKMQLLRGSTSRWKMFFFMKLDIATSNIGDAIIEGLNLKVEDYFFMNLYLAISNIRNAINEGLNLKVEDYFFYESLQLAFSNVRNVII